MAEAKAKEWEELVKKHTDTSVKVFGHYAAVKLPIDKGVPLWNPTNVAIGPDGVMYAANYTGEIYSLQDTDGDGLEDEAKLFCDVKDDGLRYPTSMIFKENKLYVGTTQEIRVYEDTDGDGEANTSNTFFSDFPYTLHPFDWTFGLEVGPEGYIYAILCTDSWNSKPAKDPEGLRGSILKIAPDGKSYERFASGLRFAYGMEFNTNGHLFFSDNRGNENKYEELNWAKKDSFYGNNLPKFPNHPPITEPILKIKTGFAPTGITFNKEDNDFGGTAGDLFIALYGPDGQWEEGGVSRVRLTLNNSGGYDVQEFSVINKMPKVSDVEFGKDGNLYVAQFGIEDRMHTPNKNPIGEIYKLIVAPWVLPDTAQNDSLALVGNIKEGQRIFTERTCVTCHTVDGSDNLLGPDLMGVGKLLSKEQLLESINEPERNIKTGFDTYTVIKNDGSVLNGRMITVNEKEISLMVVGNQVLRINRDEIQSQELVGSSLMPTGLLSGLSEDEVENLLGYLNSLKMKY
ncbi:c-type cytochrome [uncultured Zobellia sp.]|uniref:DUF7133 domain-containing protein n=1 Tax=uncultured Zobellia sp. TaxID=255433 RepID=UPI002598F4E6|nr:c-type cytochrome [uncultured Zobellia sp.]